MLVQNKGLLQRVQIYKNTMIDDFAITIAHRSGNSKPFKNEVEQRYGSTLTSPAPYCNIQAHRTAPILQHNLKQSHSSDMAPSNRAAYLVSAKKSPLEVRSAPYTKPDPGQITIKTHAVATNPLDFIKQT